MSLVLKWQVRAHLTRSAGPAVTPASAADCGGRGKLGTSAHLRARRSVARGHSPYRPAARLGRLTAAAVPFLPPSTAVGLAGRMAGHGRVLAIAVALACVGASSAQTFPSPAPTTNYGATYGQEYQYLEYHERDDAMKDINDPSLQPDQLDARIRAKAEEFLDVFAIPTPNYLTNGFLKPENARVLTEVSRINEEYWKDNDMGWGLYNDTIKQRDIEWFYSWDRNVSAVYGNNLLGALEWMDLAVDTWTSGYLTLIDNQTTTQQDIARMSRQFDAVMMKHATFGTATGGLLTSSKSPGEKFTLAMNVMCFILNLLNLIGLATFLILKRKVGPSAVLDTEMTFPSSPTAQI